MRINSHVVNMQETLHFCRDAGRQWLPRILALCVSIGVGILFVEIALRALAMDEPRVWEPDPVLGWRHVPGAQCHWRQEGQAFVRINSLGFRDRERTRAKPPGTFRIAVLGDSMTEAVQVDLEQTFTYRLEEMLRGAGRQVEVLNFGMNGYSTTQELLLLKEVEQYDPDLVILAVFLDNDVAGCHPRLSGSVSSPYAAVGNEGLQFDFSPAEQSYRHYHREPVHSVRKLSGLYRFLRAAPWKRVGAGSGSGHSQGIPLRYRFYQESSPADWDESWVRFEGVLREFLKSMNDRNKPWVLVSVPAGQIVNESVWESILQRHPAMRQESWNTQGPEERLAAFAKCHEIPYVQALPAFRQATDRGPLFFGQVGHFTPEGHAVMAEVLNEFLEEFLAHNRTCWHEIKSYTFSPSAVQTATSIAQTRKIGS
jgi:lysophospholipase L1-like esterase